MAVCARRRPDPARAALAQALGAEVVLYTSPNAVAAAAAIRAPKASRGQQVLAVGSGTRRALHRLGVAADAPGRMDSEGLLAMPQLAAVARRRIGLVAGAGGRVSASAVATSSRRRPSGSKTVSA